MAASLDSLRGMHSADSLTQLGKEPVIARFMDSDGRHLTYALVKRFIALGINRDFRYGDAWIAGHMRELEDQIPGDRILSRISRQPETHTQVFFERDKRGLLLARIFPAPVPREHNYGSKSVEFRNSFG